MKHDVKEGKGVESEKGGPKGYIYWASGANHTWAGLALGTFQLYQPINQ